MIELDRPITIRPAHAADAAALHRLAALDSAELPAGPLLVAEVHGSLCAALSLSDGSAIADPFTPTADVVALLRERVRIAGARGFRRPVWRLSLRRAATRLA